MGYSRTEYSYTGATQDFAVNFALGYLEQEDVQVYVVGEVDGLGDQVYRDYTWVDAGTVRVTDPIPNPSTVVVERTVDKDQLEIAFEGNGGVTRNTLSRGFRHLMMNIHELLDGRVDSFQGTILDEVEGLKDQAVSARDTAVASAAAAALSAAEAAEDADDVDQAISGVSDQVQADVFANDTFFTLAEYGGVGNDQPADTAAANAALAALPADGGTIVLSDGVNYLIDIASLVTGGKEVQWVGSGTVNSTIYPDLPGVVELWSASNNRRVFYDGDTEPNEFVRYDYQRNADYIGGATGVTSVLRGFTTVGANAGQSGVVTSEWPVQARIDNYSEFVNGVALTGQARRHGLSANWAGHFNAIDYIDSNLSTRAIWGFEANIQGDGSDDNNLRRIGGFVAHSKDQVFKTATPNADVIGRGLFIYPDTANLRYGIHFDTLDGAGTTKGKFLGAPIRMDVVATDLMQLYNEEDAGRVKYGSKLNTGTIGQLLVAGNTSTNLNEFYSEIRTVIENNTEGAEKGIMRFLTPSGTGVRQTKIQINGDASNPISLMLDGVLAQVTVGPADSAGTGYRQLRILN